MKHMSRATLLAAAHVMMRAPECKEAPDIELLLGEHTKAVREAVEGFEGDTAALRSELTELSQRFAQMRRSGGGGFGEDFAETWGAQVAGSERFKSYMDLPQQDRPPAIAFSVKAIGSAAGSAGALAEPMRDGTVNMPRRRPLIRGLLGKVNTQTGNVEYAAQKTRTNNAAVVAEGALKPESTYEWELKDAKIRTIAHWVEVNRQIMDDVPQLAGLIDGELTYGLDLVEDAELVYGDGTGEHLEGLAIGATAYSAPFALAGATMIDQIGLALLQSALTDVEPDGIVVHPSDWLRMCLVKDAAGGYLIQNPQGTVSPMLFGVPVVPTKGIQIDKFLVGPYSQGATLYDRMETEIRISDQDRDNFVRNKLTVRAEKRLGLAKKRPASFIYGDFGNVA